MISNKLSRCLKAKSLWNKTNISYKFGTAFGLLLALIIIVAATGYFALNAVYNAERSIELSNDIQRLVLEMDRGMERSRRLHNSFFLRYPLIGFEEAHKIYIEPSLQQVKDVIETSSLLKQKLSSPDLDRFKTSHIAINSQINLTLYLSFANRFADTSLESVNLATKLFMPQKGLEARLDNCFDKLLSEIDDKEPRLKEFSLMMGIMSLKYRISRQRFLMQSAFNEAFKFKQEIKKSIHINLFQNQKIEFLLEQWIKIAEEILKVDVEIKGKLNDFAIQANSVAPISKSLITLANEEVKSSRDGINRAYFWAIAVIIFVTFIGIGFAILIFNLLNISITKRVIALTDMAAKFRSQDKDVSTEGVEEDEISQLTHTFDLMAIRIESLVNNLEQEVQLRTEELADSQKRLHRAEKMEAVGVLASGVAHDLNNILSAIIGYPEIILMQIPKGSQIELPLKAIMESGYRAAAVVADLLTLARGAASNRTVENINKMVEQYINSPEFQKLQESNFDIIYNLNCDPELDYISCSAIHIRKLIMNLVMNASEAIHNSGSVTISTRNEYIDQNKSKEHGLCEGRYVLLNITDTGEGISYTDIKHIFEPFYTRKVMGKSGTGLGLTVVWNTVQDHNGAITVKSDSNGTSFNLYFPSFTDTIPYNMIESLDKNGDKAELELLKGNGEKILVVDDEPHQIDLATRMLTILNYEAIGVESGEKAVEYIKTDHVDMVLLDMIMSPGINGRETYEQIIKLNPLQKAIIASGYAESEDVKRACQMGVSAYLKKPYSIEQLARVVHQLLF